MEVSLDQYRAAIGLINRFKFTSCRTVILLPILFLVILLVLMLSLSILLLMSGSDHPNPGPNSIDLSIVHLNVRSLNVNDKLSEISVLACLHGFEVFAFSETWLNSSVSNTDRVYMNHSQV